MTIEELKSKIEKAEKSLSSPMLQSNPSILESVKKNIENYKKQLAELENKAEKKVEDAEKKVEDAETKVEKKEAAKEVQKAKEEVKKVEEVKEKVEEVKEKVEVKVRPKASEGTGAARKKMPKKASSPKKMVVPKNARMDKLAISKRKMRAAKAKAPVKAVVKATPSVKAKVKTARAFGQVIEYKNDVEFCAKLKAAFKKRRAAAKSAGGKRRKTKPVFGVITNSVKNAVSKALHSVSTKEIGKNPKQFLAKAERLEKSAMRFLEDFKSILGNDFKKSNITSEFGELEKAIKQFVAKIAK